MSESPSRNRNENNTPERERPSSPQTMSDAMLESPNRNRNENNTPEREQPSSPQTMSDAMLESPNRNRNENNTPEREQPFSPQTMSDAMLESPNRNENENNTSEREQRRSLTQTISDAADSTRNFISNALGLRQEQDNMSTPTHLRTENYSNVHTPRNLLSPATVASSLATPRSISSPRTPRRSQISHDNTPRKSQTSTPRRRINTNPENLAENPDNDLLKEYYEGIKSGSATPRTPRRQQRRGDIHSARSAKRLIDLDIQKGDEDVTMLEAEEKITTDQIWGTTIKVEEVRKSFKKFLKEFKLSDLSRRNGRSDDDPFYIEYLKIIERTEEFKFNLDTQNLLAFEDTHKLYYQIVRYPQEIIPILDYVVAQMYTELHEKEPKEDIRVRPYNLGISKNMRELNPSDIDQLVCIKGLLIRSSPILPEMAVAFFRCSICDKSVEVEVDRSKIDEPSRCPRKQCNSSGTMVLIHNRSIFKDKQVCRLQETPDCIPDGQTPHTISLCLYDNLVDIARPGDKIELTAIYRSSPIRVNNRQRTIKSLFKTYLDVVHIRRSENIHENGDNDFTQIYHGLEDENKEVENKQEGFSHDHFSRDQKRKQLTFTEADIQYFKELSKNPLLYETLAHSLAPSIFGMDDVKKGILLQLFGGTNKLFRKSGSPRFRGDINVLLVGDPGTSKSQMLQYVHKIVPRGIYTSGKGSSAVGLTAYVTRDPDTKQMVLESGALVLSDGGVCCIDEFDKMSDGTRAVLHEVMEQQTVSVAKAGIITTLNARTSILASANPIDSKYDPKKSIVRNIDLPPTLMSRFDLIYLVLDKIDKQADWELATHLVSLYAEDSPFSASVNILPVETLAKYIHYARIHYNPIIGNDEAHKALVDAYVSLRRLGQDPRSSENIVTATTRQLESMIRLAEAHARMRLSNTVEMADVEEAERLLREAIKLSALDPETGRIDLDLITTGHGSYERRLLTVMRDAFQKMLNRRNITSINWKKALEDFNEQSDVKINEKQFETMVNSLEQEGILRLAGNGNDREIITLNEDDE
ncbi:MCM-domain-containing protein [Rhizophagus irregularis]|uniref:DNA helicase n=1 Tax=Rhizophagus irregularis TaxID=588596 RepID=A0A2N1P3U8_9GLOM|nr:MCM-domain-containing protein [Rhizophagus irregularis]